MYNVIVRIGAFSKIDVSFDLFDEASDYIMEQWKQQRDEALLFHDDLDEDAVRQLILSDYMIEEVTKCK